MSLEESTPSLDLVRWTFTINPEHRAAIEGHLSDLGLDVIVHDDSRFVISWEEPDESANDVIEEIWALNGEPFEISQEEFHRMSLSVLQQAEEDVHEAA